MAVPTRLPNTRFRRSWPRHRCCGWIMARIGFHHRVIATSVVLALWCVAVAGLKQEV
ncbi:hypothetical protein K60_025790 [Mycobacterium tuberculosis variant bovis BCG str. Korea 1168P]|uniref:Uncharacterized protein n=1 Tax=Mycobacterium tuberculosis (strain CDC 1551 / Oshkosh) TaxID=83331 RepID=Q8VJH5_MYCTO|nr:hypothetical protein MT2558 [Mycobacterium tuberculosis CDC1551]AGE68489.1 hypothetical protein K60_025790 [Mycobacterium tuberculosis variant bovis BCG str. Korea 1168P]AGM01063.1 hypothetical protein CFBS_2630 [Mycobacterium tuberculosis CCDC5079]AHJ43275.1 hypothetical protein HKBS1_2629 [Mycobacterium tuberculosis HKBS1]AHJ47422.1 hypothetical protein HKBT2_2625 [Mycobacterium tuberculosis BT2]AHJ51568.1 hypothetical protein HKBT1_2622 [Mycobacterium tuberculosis BT1]AHJ55716.1 hypothe